MYTEVVRPVLGHLDSETAHHAVRELLHFAESHPFTLDLLERFAYEGRRFADDRLHVLVGDVMFENPLIVGAGWDKDGRAVRGLHRLGFAGVEVGSVLAYPQMGNEKPRQWMVTPGVCINNIGLASQGLENVAHNLDRYHADDIPIGINIARNSNITNDQTPLAYSKVAAGLYPYASFFVINASCPNVPDGCSLQDENVLTEIVAAVQDAMDSMGKRKPLFVKISPDLTTDDIDEVIRVVVDNNISGVVATNATTEPRIISKYGSGFSNRGGGLSGDDAEYRRRATDVIAHIYSTTDGQVTIMGVGGVNSTKAALEKIQAGAKIVQIVTGMRSEGPSLPGRINRGLVKWLESNGIDRIESVVGTHTMQGINQV